MNVMGKFLIIAGVMLIVLGLLLSYSSKLTCFLNNLGIGKLPGDVHIKKENFVFYFPLMSCIVISLVLTFILNVIFRLWRR